VGEGLEGQVAAAQQWVLEVVKPIIKAIVKPNRSGK